MSVSLDQPRTGLSRLPLPLIQIGLVLSWSSSFIGALLAADSGSVVRILLWRFIIVSLIFAPFIWRALRSGVNLRWVGIQVVLGAIGMFACVGMGFEAINLGLPAGTASLISALQPLATAVLSGAVLGTIVARRQWLGLAIGFLGVALSVGDLTGSDQYLGYASAIGCMLAMVVATLIANATWNGDHLLAALGIQSAVTALLFLPLALWHGVAAPLADMGFLLPTAWAIAFSTLGAYGFYYLSLARSGPVRTTSLIYLTPPVTALWAWAMFGQPVSVFAVIGLVLCFAGVWLARGGETGK